ncbi:hypothetical protein [Streptomyces sp. NRRL S-350]|uniref:hypothetical protein n=1 Tax=Streptomyces sp. NRRL S-350 TaxID=1463902 RepID=UPI00131E728A|nr:hypothetical protein [Streptomyces sp. NRRL S-350]
MSDEAASLDGGAMYAVDVGGGPLRPLGMQAWAVEAQRAQVVFAASHRVETFASAGGRGPDPHLAGLASGGWARFDDFEGWAEPAAGWSAVLDVGGDVLTVTGRAGVCFYEGGLNSSRAWRRTARRHGVFVALAGSIAGPWDVREAQLRGEMYALLCPVVLV